MSRQYTKSPELVAAAESRGFSYSHFNINTDGKTNIESEAMQKAEAMAAVRGYELVWLSDGEVREAFSRKFR